MPARSSNAEKRLRSSLRTRTRLGQTREAPGDGAQQGAKRDASELRIARLTERARDLEVPSPPATEATEASDAGELESELGEATYTCTCGFIFQAPVLTSVACPHCGECQGW